MASSPKAERNAAISLWPSSLWAPIDSRGHQSNSEVGEEAGLPPPTKTWVIKRMWPYGGKYTHAHTLAHRDTHTLKFTLHEKSPTTTKIPRCQECIANITVQFYCAPITEARRMDSDVIIWSSCQFKEAGISIPFSQERKLALNQAVRIQTVWSSSFATEPCSKWKDWKLPQCPVTGDHGNKSWQFPLKGILRSYY